MPPFGTGCGQYRSFPYRLDRKVAVTVLTKRIRSYFYALMARIKKKNPFFDGTVCIK